MSYKIIIYPQAEKEFDKIQKELGRLIIKKIYAFIDTPRPNGFKKLTGFKSERTTIKECFPNTSR